MCAQAGECDGEMGLHPAGLVASFAGQSPSRCVAKARTALRHVAEAAVDVAGKLLDGVVEERAVGRPRKRRALCV